MPLYEYKCDHCKVLFELIRPVGAPRTERCEECGNKIERVPSAPGGFRGLPTPKFHGRT